ncbi:MAG: hypothetical protein IKG14_06485 [Clostridia bacterium]|nr:hypothetical protein [Clostridia bacterium]
MLLGEFRNKNVKMLVSSNSGVAAYAIAGAVSSVVSINGTITDFDDEFIKVSNAQISKDKINWGKMLRKVDSQYENVETILVNRNDIITIALISE